MVTNEIIDKLKQIEIDEQVTIIGAVESGSRAWGFESNNSDYDVRFIYVRKIEDYLKLGSVKDVIEYPIDDIFDINGWDIKKALNLLYKGNQTLIEWCHSEVIYKSTEAFTQLKDLANQYFDQEKAIFHYLSLAKKAYKINENHDEVKLKKLFYALRSILSIQWIKAYASIPPIEIEKLKHLISDADLEHEIDRLINLKKSATESHEVQVNKTLHVFLKKQIKTIENHKEAQKQKEIYTYDALNDYFLSLFDVSKPLVSLSQVKSKIEK